MLRGYGGHGEDDSHRPYGAPLGGTKVVCRLRYFARGARAPLRRNSFASKTFSSCRTQIATDKGNSLVRHARTAHRAAAHYAWLTLIEGGKVIWLPCCQFRPRGRLPSAAVLNLRIPALTRKSEPPRAILLRKQRRREKPNAEPTANVGFLFPSRDFFSSVRKEICELIYRDPSPALRSLR